MSLAITLTLSPSCAVEERGTDAPQTDVAYASGGGGWDNNTAFWNLGMELIGAEIEPSFAPAGIGPNTLSPSNHVLFRMATGRSSPCLALDPSVTGVRIVGSRRIADRGVGPTLEVKRGMMLWTELMPGQQLDVAADVQVESASQAEAQPVVLRLHRLQDVIRPGGSVRWPHYAVTMVRDADCSVVGLPVSILGPAPDMPGAVTATPMQVSALSASFAIYASYYGSQPQSLVAKAAINLDLPMFMPGEIGIAARGCTSGVAIEGNRLVFLSAFATGATVVTYHPLDPAQAPLLVHMTKPGEPIKLHGLQVAGNTTESLCHGVFAPPSTMGLVPNPKLAAPEQDVAEFDVIHADPIHMAPLERAASSYSWFAHGVSTARRNAFLASSTNMQKSALAVQASTAIAITRMGLSLGALASWSAIREAAIGRVDTLVAAETLPATRAGDAFDRAMTLAVTTPTCGDGICGGGEMCAGDCPIAPPPIGPQPPLPSPIDAGMGADASPDAAMSPDAGLDAMAVDAAPPTDASIDSSGGGDGGGSGSDGGY